MLRVTIYNGSNTTSGSGKPRVPSARSQGNSRKPPSRSAELDLTNGLIQRTRIANWRAIRVRVTRARVSGGGCRQYAIPMELRKSRRKTSPPVKRQRTLDYSLKRRRLKYLSWGIFYGNNYERHRGDDSSMWYEKFQFNHLWALGWDLKGLLG
jgi:hypothetical protein